MGRGALCFSPWAVQVKSQKLKVKKWSSLEACSLRLAAEIKGYEEDWSIGILEWRKSSVKVCEKLSGSLRLNFYHREHEEDTEKRGEEPSVS